MGKSFDIGLERLTGASVPPIEETREGGLKPPLNDAMADLKVGHYSEATERAQPGMALPPASTFYLETFGCQMNDHDSEKVAGVLVARGYRQVDGPEAAKVILYNTCSIREKAAQKVFSRLGELRPADEQDGKSLNTEGTEEEHGGRRGKIGPEGVGRVEAAQAGVPIATQDQPMLQKGAQPGMAVPPDPRHPSLRKIVNAGGGKIIGVLGCVAQQEGEEIFERAPWVSLVCGSASYRKLPQLIAELEAGNRRVTGLDTDTDETFETEITRRDNPWRAYLTIIEGCDKACSYCVVPFTRGPERSRASASILEEVRRLAEAGYSEVQLLGQTVNSYADPTPISKGRKMRFSELLAAVAEVRGIRRVRFTTSHPRDFGKDIVEAIEAHPTICDHVHLPVQSGSTAVLRAMARTYSREEYLEKIALMKAARRPISITTDMIVGFPGETEKDFEETLTLLDEVQYDSVFAFKYSPRPNTPSLKMADAIPEEEKGRRLAILMDRQREIQRVRNEKLVGETFEVLVDGKSRRENQWSGHTSSNRVMNFTSPEQELLGDYVQVKVVSAMPNSLVGEMVGRV
jgi:tRNA-2-methylthio-N6-dimethylallyladenosine synthase